jgi:hypothetical protein
LNKKEKERADLLIKLYEEDLKKIKKRTNRMISNTLKIFVRTYDLTITKDIMYILYSIYIDTSVDKCEAWIKRHNIKIVDKLTNKLNEDATLMKGYIKFKEL